MSVQYKPHYSIARYSSTILIGDLLLSHYHAIYLNTVSFLKIEAKTFNGYRGILKCISERRKIQSPILLVINPNY